jgi:hypothetical protein
MKTTDVDQGLLSVLSVLEHEEIVGNDLLTASVVAVDRDGRKEVVYPPNFQGSFPI